MAGRQVTDLKIETLNKYRLVKPVFLIIVTLAALSILGTTNAFWQVGLLAKGTLVWWNDNKGECSSPKSPAQTVPQDSAVTLPPIITDNDIPKTDEVVLPENPAADTNGTGDGPVIIDQGQPAGSTESAPAQPGADSTGAPTGQNSPDSTDSPGSTESLSPTESLNPTESSSPADSSSLTDSNNQDVQ